MAPFLLAMSMTKITRLIPALALTLCLTGMAHAEGVRILGRYMASPTGGFTVQWPASGFEATFTGAQLVATIEDWGSNWFNIEIDGAVTTLDLQPGVNTYTPVLGSGRPAHNQGDAADGSAGWPDPLRGHSHEERQPDPHRSSGSQDARDR
jgi:Carbohydrate esterase 2 N-terminal